MKTPALKSATTCVALLLCKLVLLAADKEKAASNSSDTKKGSAPGGPEPQLVSFPSGDTTLQGWLYKPEGKGPFPAVLYNHGSEKTPGWFPPLGAFWTSKGCAFFVPHRRGHGCFCEFPV